MSRSNDEYGVTLIWLTIEATVLRASPGTFVEGHIRLQNENYIGLVCWNFFNAVIKRRRLPDDWTWVAGGEGQSAGTGKQRKTIKDAGAEDDEVSVESADNGDEVPTSAQALPLASQDDAEYLGHFVDGQRKRIDELVRFKIKNYECAPSNERERGFISLEGSLLDDEADRVADEKVMAEFKAATKMKRSGRMG